MDPIFLYFENYLFFKQLNYVLDLKGDLKNRKLTGKKYTTSVVVIIILSNIIYSACLYNITIIKSYRHLPCWDPEKNS